MGWLTAWRIRTYPRAIALALLVGWALLLLQSIPTRMTPQGVPLGGDYVVFHAAGELVVGDPQALFDRDKIFAAQEAAIGLTPLPGYHAWVYPPFVAALYAPLGALPYVPAFLVYSLLLGGLVWLATKKMMVLAPRLAPYTETVFLMTLTFYPVLRATTGGQNTAVTLFLYAALGAALAQGRDRQAGLWLGLLLYKPHFAVMAALLVLFLGRIRVLLGAGVVAIGWYLLGAAVTGLDWPLRWIEAVASYRDLEAEVNGPTLISFLGVAERLLPGSPMAWTVGAVLSSVLLGLCAVRARQVAAGGEALARYWALGAAVLVLGSPHTQFYDLGLLAVTGVVAVDRLGERVAGLLLALWAVSWIHAFVEDPTLQPLFFVALVGLSLALRLLPRVPASATLGTR